MVLKQLFRRKPLDDAAWQLYTAIVKQSRQAGFYRDLGVPDSVDGRFDLIVLHVFLVLRRLRRQPEQTADLAQALFDTMFGDMDESLREMGAGDIGVGKRVKAMMQGFYGRVSAYEVALDSANGPADAEEDPLETALARNLYGTVDAAPRNTAAIAAYMRREAAALEGQALADLAAGKVAFGPAPAAGETTVIQQKKAVDRT